MTLIVPLALAAVLAAQADPPAPPAPEFQTADAILTALEDADKAIETFRAAIVYDKIFMLQGDRHTRWGDLSFRVDPNPPDAPADQPPLRTFAVRFDWLMLDGAKREEKQAWIFDGHWLVEKRFAEKQYVAREIARPGAHVDPLRLGQGPLPIPIGQRKADILARYEVEVLPANDGFDPEDAAHANYMANLKGATQILLTPLDHRADDEFRFTSIRLWYRRDPDGLLLPILARTFDRADDETFVQLTNVRINQPIPNDVIDISQPDPNTGWDVQIERWRADEGEDASATAAPQPPPLPQADAAED